MIGMIWIGWDPKVCTVNITFSSAQFLACTITRLGTWLVLSIVFGVHRSLESGGILFLLMFS